MKERREKPRTPYLSPAVEQASKVLFCLGASKSTHTTLLEICRLVGIHKSKAYTILETLEKYGLVRRNAVGKGYALGPGLLSLSRKVLDDLSPPRVAAPILSDLARESRSTAILGLIADTAVYVAAKHEGEGDFGVTMRIGHRLPLTYGSHGKVIVAFMDKAKQERILAGEELYFHGLPEALDRARLAGELDRCRREGFAEDLGEINPGLNVVTAPVIGPGEEPIGFIEIFVLFSADAAHRLGPLVARAGKELSRQLGGSGGRDAEGTEGNAEKE